MPQLCSMASLTAGGYCRPIRHTRPAFPAHLPTLLLEKAEKSEHEETDEKQGEGREEDSELSKEEWSDLN